MYVHVDKKVAYIARPKTASSSIAHVLLNKLGFEFAGRLWCEGRCSHHEIVEPPGGWEGWSVISTIRDPLDTLVSWYFHHTKHMGEPPVFSTWLRSFIRRPNPLVVDRLFFGLKYTTHVLIYEHLQDDFNSVMVELGLPTVTLPQRNVGNKDKIPYKQFYEGIDPQLMTRVITKYERDIQDYGAYVSN